MARIDQYVSKVGLSEAPRPNTSVDNPLPQAVEGFGRSIQSVGAELQARQDKKKEFKTQNDYRKFQLELDEDLKLSQEDMPEDGTGFYDKFLKEKYATRRSEFLAKLPAEHRERFAAMTDPINGADAVEWGNKAAAVERDATYKHAERVVTETQDQLATAIDQDPDNFEAYRQAGLDEIERMPVPAAQRAAIRDSWENMSELAYYNRLVEQNPSEVHRKLGADWRKLTPDSKYKLLTDALEVQESGGEKDPSRAVSSAGALGVRQIMPGTAKDIAKELGDTSFNQNWDGPQIADYMARDSVNRAYSDYYLRKQLKTFGGDVEAALIAYNAGPGVAQKWVKMGKDDSVLPQETRKYKLEILTRMGGGASPNSVDVSVTRERDGYFYAPGVSYALQGQTRDKPVSQEYVAKVAGVLPRLGAGIAMTITSGGQDAAGTGRKRTGSTRHDVDHTDHANTSDFVLTKNGKPVTPAQDPELYARAIEEFAAAGFTGIGHYSWGIHVGGGKAAFWGPDKSNGSASQRYAVAYERGRERSGMVVDPGRPSALKYDQRQKLISNADATIQQQVRQQAAGTVVEKVELRNAIKNDIASVLTTGQGNELDSARIAEVLGDDDYLKYVERRDQAGRLFAATSDLSALPPEVLATAAAQYKPTAGSLTYADDEEVHQAVIREIDKIEALRAKDPAKAAEALPGVKEALIAADATVAKTGLPDPNAVQNYIQMSLEAQAQFDVPPELRAPVPTEWAMTVGRNFSNLPAATDKASRAIVHEEISNKYAALKSVFGDYTDEVIMYAMVKYKGISKDSAESITNLMVQIQSGRDPFNSVRAGAKEVEEERGFFGGVYDYIIGSDDAVEAEETGAVPAAVDPEVMLRVTEALRDSSDPEVVSELETKYGKPAVDAARGALGLWVGAQ